MSSTDRPTGIDETAALRISRRELLRGGSLALAGASLSPLLARISHAGTSPFDFYISPTGSDSNPGTLDQPWAITALNTKQSIYGGRRIGLLDGTYNVFSLAQAQNPASDDGYQSIFSIQGGSLGAPTVIAAVNPRQAIFDASNSGIVTTAGCHIFGNSRNSQYNHAAPTAFGYVTIDGIKFQNYFYKAIQLGDESGNTTPGYTVQNCEFTGQNISGATITGVTVTGLNSISVTVSTPFARVPFGVGQNVGLSNVVSTGSAAGINIRNTNTRITGISGGAGAWVIAVSSSAFDTSAFGSYVSGGNIFGYGGNSSGIELFSVTNAIVQNNYFHDFVGFSRNADPNATDWGDHLCSITLWGKGSGSYNNVFQYNTIVNAGTLLGKEENIWGYTVAYNFIENGRAWGSSMMMWAGETTKPYGVPSYIHHNIFSGSGVDLRPLGAGVTFDYFPDTLYFYNNTIYGKGTSNGGFIGSVAAGSMTMYNNIIYLEGAGDCDFMVVNFACPGVMDYDCYYSAAGANVYGYFDPIGAYARQSVATLSAWRALMSNNPETHALDRVNPLFARSGSGARYYSLASNSPCINAGRSNGLPGGNVCNMGAWDGTTAQIGCDFLGVVPSPPSNVSVT